MDSSPWAGEGGHVLFSDGTVRWFEEAQNDKGDGVFIKAIDKGEDVPIPSLTPNPFAMRFRIPGRFTILETKDSSSSSFLSC